MSEPIDLRSDTVTRPTEAMRLAMYRAEVGDDEYGDDTTTARLQELAAEKLGKEAALYVPSGTMANAVAGRVFLRPYDVVMCEARSAIYQAGHLAGSDAEFRLINGDNGLMTSEQIQASLAAASYVGIRPRLFTLENTFNLAGGIVLTPQYIQTIADLVHSAGAAFYLDGARVFNAAVAQGIDVKQLTAPFDAAMFCISKGLGAPIGSLIVGSQDFISQARRIRKRLGGQQRQTGLMAAAGIVALNEMVERLAEDHARARRLAEALTEAPGIELNLDLVQTNMVWFGVKPLGLNAYEFVELLGVRGVLSSAYAEGRVRLVTHKDISDADIDTAIRVIFDCVSDLIKHRQLSYDMSRRLVESS